MAVSLRARSLRHLRIRGRNDSGEENVPLDLSRGSILDIRGYECPSCLQLESSTGITSSVASKHTSDGRQFVKKIMTTQMELSHHNSQHQTKEKCGRYPDHTETYLHSLE